MVEDGRVFRSILERVTRLAIRKLLRGQRGCVSQLWSPSGGSLRRGTRRSERWRAQLEIWQRSLYCIYIIYLRGCCPSRFEGASSAVTLIKSLLPPRRPGSSVSAGRPRGSRPSPGLQPPLSLSRNSGVLILALERTKKN